MHQVVKFHSRVIGTMIPLWTACMLMTVACKPVGNDKHGLVGKYQHKETGVIILEIGADTAGYYAINPDQTSKNTSDSIRLKNFDQLESEWSGYCGESIESWIANDLIGGIDWKENFKLGLYNSDENFFFISLKKGYVSKEHNYSTGYCVIAGKECLEKVIYRINVEKIRK